MLQNSVLPTHIAIVPDGNRRWARKQNLPDWQGHREGIGKNSEDVATLAADLGIKYLTIWGGSYDNFVKRPALEVKEINKTYRLFIDKILENEALKKHQTRVTFLGEWQDLLEEETKAKIEEIQTKTATNKGFQLTILSAYNGDRELVAAVQGIVQAGEKKISNEVIKKHLWTADLPPVDLIIRTGGEFRLSTGFMMWDIPYAELYFTNTLWPDFGKKELEKALSQFSQRERRFGK